MVHPDGTGFHFGLEAEFLLVDAQTFRPLWHPDLKFAELNRILEAIPCDGLPPLDGLKVEPPHRKPMPFVVEGYHLPDKEFNPIDLLPKGIEIRTPRCASIGECLRCLQVLHARLQQALAGVGYQAVVVSFHPLECHFEGPQNKRRHDFWQWAMEAMVTYGPDVNIGLPPDVARRLDPVDLHAKVNYYAPALTALSLASPLYRGGLWQWRGRVGKSVRTFYRSVTAPAIEIHRAETDRLEYKTFDMSWRLPDYHNYFLLWLMLLLDDGLAGRASKEARIYDLGEVAYLGLEAPAVRERAAEILDRAPTVLPARGFDARPLESFRWRLETGVLPADEVIEQYSRDPCVPALLRRFTALAADAAAPAGRPTLARADDPSPARQSAHRETAAGN
jgi:carboxylate-amine ligase